MLNDSFSHMDTPAKDRKIRNIIRSKARGISEENLGRIMSMIDIEKQYTITGSANFDSLRRNAYEEDGGDKYQVKVKIIYGRLSPGFVKERNVITEPAACDLPAAFIKNIRIFLHGESLCQDCIFIYQKRVIQETFSLPQS